ncbi:hypothetical protein [Paenibacillus popilliae]|uniref:Copper amine oxidase-like N-terminal domain-containing protein n=1 Tax=Paenibacillus popilliae TaxID=78057 RepID=A0ABY3ATU8_PAEPP|nr:hypothetical protein [Paenibacillus sp. SDF0028]TQR45937.1 hypothetical protein C7Y44_09535 [Paenibacillus sp. SDF0028]
MMKTLSKIMLCTALGTMIALGTAYAGSNLNLLINGHGVVTEKLDLQAKDGKVLVPIDRLAEEFKGKAVYDADKNEVQVTLPDSAQQAIQIQRLEAALVPSTAKEALDTWVKGIQTRNGALQFAVFSPELRSKTKKEFEDYKWTTGGSSPHMSEIDKLKTKSLNKTTTQFSFDYGLVASNWEGKGSAVVTVQKLTSKGYEGWFITNIKMKDPSDTGITIGVEPYKK